MLLCGLHSKLKWIFYSRHEFSSECWISFLQRNIIRNDAASTYFSHQTWRPISWKHLFEPMKALAESVLTKTWFEPVTDDEPFCTPMIFSHQVRAHIAGLQQTQTIIFSKADQNQCRKSIFIWWEENTACNLGSCLPKNSYEINSTL